jgi:uncharacterized membrane protein (UPF0127 family)
MAPRIRITSALSYLCLSVFICGSFFLTLGCDRTKPGNSTTDGKTPLPVAQQPDTQRVVINDIPFDLELAVTPAQRYRGLSDRASIADNGGILFVFPEEEEVSFVMRRCLVPIDIAYVTEKGEVAAMYEMKVVPYDSDEDELPGHPSHRPVLCALEFKGGTLARIGLKRGDYISLPYADLKARAK